MYEYMIAFFYMFFLHLTGEGQETFSNTNVKRYGKHLIIIIFLILLLFHTDCCLPNSQFTN